jgi:D-alanyl-D-alanine dipeptidase
MQQTSLIDVISLSKKLCAFPIQGELAYAGKENFLGRIVDGYAPEAKHICLLTPRTAYALCNVQNALNKINLGLYVFDAYRPLRAVKDFASWFHAPVASSYELERKRIHYPHIEKADLVPLGYAPDTISKHNFGNVVDLSLINLSTSSLLNMGACFDYFDKLSHQAATAEEIGQEAYGNRRTLKANMEQHGFIPYEYEFWHFEYYLREVDEPMDIAIDLQLA